jgi:D-beta-D-heptose 7-phosphate kinase/D-beta-D-heptose 1-phosphate adenosyltransferase
MTPPRAADKLVTVPVACERIRAWRAAGERVVLAEGVFDLLRASHVRSLARARSLGERLVVAVLDDRMAGRELGAGRPLVPQSDRARVCAALRAVDLVAMLGPEPFADLMRDGRSDLHARGVDPELIAARGDRAADSKFASLDVSEPPGPDLVARLREGGGRG